jgi:uncharacterized Ntn-hydrolase superfamily protein
MRRFAAGKTALQCRRRPLSTYSLVACDLERREWGVAVQSKFLAVGSIVAWAEPEVGAIATQSYANPLYGPDGLRLLRDGVGAVEVATRLTEPDEQRDLRQLGVVDAAGGAASFTGSGCLGWAGGRTGPCYAAQGNILVSGATVDGLAETFEQTAGEPLAERLLASLAAAQAAGGDRRGQQSAALYVVEKGGGYDGFDVLVDLRVDDHPTPIAELERLYGLHQLYFGTTPEEEWLAADEALAAELRERLAELGYASGDLQADFTGWAGVENLEERVKGIDRIDPVVLQEIRKR